MNSLRLFFIRKGEYLLHGHLEEVTYLEGKEQGRDVVALLKRDDGLPADANGGRQVFLRRTLLAAQRYDRAGYSF